MQNATKNPAIRRLLERNAPVIRYLKLQVGYLETASHVFLVSILQLSCGAETHNHYS